MAKSAHRQGPVEPTTDQFPIVGVGASAGGVLALQNLFERLPANTGAAFVVILHLDPHARSELAAILAGRSAMPVDQVTAVSTLEQNHVYVIPPDRQLRISDGEIAAIPFAEVHGHRAPIDLYFRSLADQRGGDVAVVLSGAGADGSIGTKQIKEAGGIVLVQSPEEAEYPSMPRSVIAIDAADFVLPLAELADKLAEILRIKQQLGTAGLGADEEDNVRRILTHLRARTGHDFSHYKRSTVTRRILRRMQVTRAEKLGQYFSHLRENTDEAHTLMGDLLISVTTFFRDPKAFEALATLALPRLFDSKGAGGTLRIWAAGCATGEEAYALAMLLLEEAGRHEERPEIQIFASDLDAKALAVAREGRYPATIENDVSPERLRRFFTADGDMYRVKQDLRDMVLFANHSILKDPPFSCLDLVSCRNLLIYLDREVQQQALAILHYGLNSDGYLFLGSSETADHPDGLFRVVDRDARLYQSTGKQRDRLPMLPRLSGLAAGTQPAGTIEPHATKARIAQTAHREALEALAPPSVLVDEALHVVHLSESAGRYLMPSGGPLATEVTELVRQELRFDLRAALNRAFERGQNVLSPPISVRFNGRTSEVQLLIRPVPTADPKKGQRRALVVFIEGSREDQAGSPPDAATMTSDAMIQLKHELELAQQRLRTTREESETANEELRAANEELQSINEEYRSTAEELETSREELQSINEELQTVNSELKSKVETVSRANSDLQNLMAATDFATLFLDSELCIKRFTPRFCDLFNVTASDIGRPITDFTHVLEYESLADDSRQVLKRLVPIEREVRGRNGGWFEVRVRPYRTVDDKIDGVVVTLLDISNRRIMEDALGASEQSLRQEMRLVELSRAPIFVWDLDGGVRQWNRGSEELYGYAKEEAMGRRMEQLLRTEVPGSSFAAVKAELEKMGSWKGELLHHTKDGRVLTIESQLELYSTPAGRLVLESTRDITGSKAWEIRQRLLLRELTHRVKNTLTVIQAMVHQTWRNTHTPEEFIEKLNGRITALANAHKMLVDSQWEGADLYGLVQYQVASYLGERPERLHIKGEAVRLPPDVATPFGLVLHELAVNAAKYGALSVDKGEIDLVWRMEERNGNKVLSVIWQERNGPPVTTPKRVGFGSRLIRSGVPNSVVSHELLPDGVRCTIEIADEVLGRHA
ncbi:MAG: PAS domain-containing protein [Alphaproteobacteria bacterium]|nr:PAS domain-containing protein [Alphaproteobacteria bacterium]